MAPLVRLGSTVLELSLLKALPALNASNISELGIVKDISLGVEVAVVYGERSVGPRRVSAVRDLLKVRLVL